MFMIHWTYRVTYVWTLCDHPVQNIEIMFRTTVDVHILFWWCHTRVVHLKYVVLPCTFVVYVRTYVLYVPMVCRDDFTTFNPRLDHRPCSKTLANNIECILRMYTYLPYVLRFQQLKFHSLRRSLGCTAGLVNDNNVRIHLCTDTNARMRMVGRRYGSYVRTDC